MEINKGFILKEMTGSDGNKYSIIIAVGEAQQKIKGYLTLNGTATFLWNNLKTAKDECELIKKLALEYNIDEALAKKDVENFLENLKKLGVINV